MCKIRKMKKELKKFDSIGYLIHYRLSLLNNNLMLY